MSAVRNRAEDHTPAALRQPAAPLKSGTRVGETRTDQAAQHVPSVPSGSIAAIETRLGF